MVQLDSSDAAGDGSQQLFNAERSEDMQNLIRRLHTLPEVKHALRVRNGITPASFVNPSDDDERAEQWYLDPAPDGIDARYAWSFPGGDGIGVGFVDAEVGWDLNHEDLVAANIIMISGENYRHRDHGTAVLGQVLMVDSGIGGVGIAPKATGSCGITDPRWDIRCIPSNRQRHEVMKFGDFLLLEAHRHGEDFSWRLSSKTGDYWPVEIDEDIHHAMHYATSRRIIVVEAGGRGCHNLDDYKDSS